MGRINFDLRCQDRLQDTELPTISQRVSRAIEAKPAPKDEDIFTFALNLEYMEAEFYLRATTGKGISDADVGLDAARVVGGHEAHFSNIAIREFVEELT